MNGFRLRHWEKIRLGDCILVLTDYHANGSYKKLKENVELLDEESFAVMIRTTNFEKKDFLTDLKFINKQAYEFLSKSKVLPGDILMNKIANAGSVYYMPDLRRPVSLAMNLFLIRTDARKANQKYVFYYLKANEGYIKQFAVGTAATTITKKAVRELEIFLPTLLTQQKISAVLSAYDDLIENNARRIALLEEMARLLYREWFVHFRFPGHEQVKLVDSPLGKIPEGWEVKTLESLLENHIGGGWGKDEPDEKHLEPAWVIRGTDIPPARSGTISNVPYRYHTPSNLRSRIIQPGDILFEVSGGSKGQLVGRTLLITHKFLSAFGSNKVICASFCKRVRPEKKGLGAEPLYLSFVEGYESGEIEQFQVQSTGISNFKWTEYIKKVQRAVPPEPVLIRFSEITEALFEHIANIGLQSSNLRTTRDLLLPKLISGEVDVADLEINVPEIETAA